MPVPNLGLSDGSLPAFRGLRTVAVATDDIRFPAPVTVRAVSAGNLDVVDSLGREHSFDGLSAGDSVTGPGGGLVLITEIKGTSTVTSVQIGII